MDGVPVTVIPPTEVAAFVPEPETPRLAPVPITIAAVVFVPLVKAEKAGDPIVIVWQPNPVPEVQIKAEVEPLHEGTAKAEGVVAVRAPTTVFAA